MLILLLSVIVLFPIVIWGYIFSYIDWDRLNKQRFIIGIVSWFLGVIPIFFYDKIFKFLKISYLFDVFSNFSLLKYYLIVFIFFTLIFIFSLLFSLFCKNENKKVLKYMFYSLLLFCFISFLYSQLLVFFDFIWLFNHIKLGELRELSFWWVSVFGLNMIVFYYLFVALIEELSKHINFLGTSLGFVKTINKWVLYTFFVALGFVFLENILYIYNTYIAYWLSSDTITVYFSRSVFSLMLHIFCSWVIAYYFSKAYLEYWKSFNLWYVKNLLIWIFFSVLLHSFFDISLEFGWTFVMILYFVFWYFYITSIFYKS